jgi:hypothetical protein
MAMVAGGVLFGVLLFVAVRPDQGSAAEGVAPVAAPTSSSSESPATSTTSTTSTMAPTTTTTTTILRGDLVIQGVGDVNFDPDYITAFAESGYQIAFDGLDGIFLSDDLTVINLECPPTDAGTQLDKQFSFRCDPASLPVARANGVDVASLANNHGQDRGTEGMLDSIANLRAPGSNRWVWAPTSPRRPDPPCSRSTGGRWRCSGWEGCFPAIHGWRPTTARDGQRR